MSSLCSTHVLWHVITWWNLARYYSLCDIGILAPTFVMVIEFHLCDDDEFHLCDDILVSSLWRRWVSSLWGHIVPIVCRWWVPFLWRQMNSVFVTALSCGPGLDFLVLEQCFTIAHSIFWKIFVLYYFNHFCHFIHEDWFCKS